jgi:hypothetical protein
MKFSIFPKFGALNSQPVFQAFTIGAKNLGHTVTEHDMTADVFVIWSVLWSGRMAQNQEIWKIAKNTGKKLLILEVGGLVRGTTWRIGLGHVNRNGFFNNDNLLENCRSKKLGIFMKNWRNFGEHVLICGQHSQSEQWSNKPSPEIWAKNLIEEIKKYTDRKIIVRPHPRDYQWSQKIENLGVELKIPQKIQGTYDDFNHDNDFKDAWCVINPSSNTGILAAIEGIPVFCDVDSLAYPVSTKNLEKIEELDQPDRTDWLEKICHTEWTLEEIERGIPIGRIFNKNVDNA